MCALVHEIAEKDDALGHFSCETQRLTDALEHALKKHNEQRGMANDLRDQLAEARSESLADREQLAAARKFNAARNDASALRERELLQKCSDLEKQVNKLSSDLKTKQECLTRVRIANERLDKEKQQFCHLLDQSNQNLQVLEQKMRTQSTEEEEVVDDCSPVPRCRQEAAASAKSTDPDGKHTFL